MNADQIEQIKQLPLEAHRSIRLLGMSLFFALLGVFMILVVFRVAVPALIHPLSQTPRKDPIFVLVVFIICSSLVGPLMLLAALKLACEFTTSEALIFVDREGLRDLRVSAERMLWSEVLSYRVSSMTRGGLLGVTLELRKVPPRNRRLRFLLGRGLWRSKNSTRVFVSVRYLNVAPEKIVKAIIALMDRYEICVTPR